MADEFEFPAAFHDADSAAIAAQARFLRSTRIQLLLLVLASGLGVFSWAVAGLEVAALAAGIAFLSAAAMRLVLLRGRPHREWYEARAVAESLKTISWRYAVGGNPFSVERGGDVRAAFVAQEHDVLTALATLDPEDPAGGRYEATESMERMRRLPLEARREAYVRGRIEDQFSWYSRKSEWNRRSVRLWGTAVLALQLGGALGAFLLGFRVIEFDLFGVAAALAASGAAWVETKQHGNLASAYRVAADELRRIRDLSSVPHDDRTWAQFVSDAEEAISREHTMWKATATNPARLA